MFFLIFKNKTNEYWYCVLLVRGATILRGALARCPGIAWCSCALPQYWVVLLRGAPVLRGARARCSGIAWCSCAVPRYCVVLVRGAPVLHGARARCPGIPRCSCAVPRYCVVLILHVCAGRPNLHVNMRGSGSNFLPRLVSWECGPRAPPPPPYSPSGIDLVA
jgi:hypothetical protein